MDIRNRLNFDSNSVAKPLSSDSLRQKPEHASSNEGEKLYSRLHQASSYEERKKIIADKLRDLDTLYQSIFSSVNFNFKLPEGAFGQKLIKFLEHGLRLYDPQDSTGDLQTFLENYLLKHSYPGTKDLRAFLKKQRRPLLRISREDVLNQLFDRAYKLVDAIVFANIFYVKRTVTKAGFHEDHVNRDDVYNLCLKATKDSVRFYDCQRKDAETFHTYLFTTLRRKIDDFDDRRVKTVQIGSHRYYGDRFGTTADPSSEVESRDFNEHLGWALSQLSDQQRFVLENKVLADQPLSLAKLGEVMGVSTRQATKLYNQAIQAIKDLFDPKNFGTFMASFF